MGGGGGGRGWVVVIAGAEWACVGSLDDGDGYYERKRGEIWEE